MTQDKKGASAMKRTANWHLLQRRMAHAPQADAGDDGATACIRSADSSRRCLPRRRAQRGQARARRAGQDPFRRRGRDQRRGPPVAREAHRGRGLPNRNRRLGALLSLACFNGVTAAGCVHEPIKAAVPEFRWVNTMSRAPCAAPTIDSSQVCPALSRSSSTGSIVASKLPDIIPRLLYVA